MTLNWLRIFLAVAGTSSVRAAARVTPVATQAAGPPGLPGGAAVVPGRGAAGAGRPGAAARPWPGRLRPATSSAASVPAGRGLAGRGCRGGSGARGAAHRGGDHRGRVYPVRSAAAASGPGPSIRQPWEWPLGGGKTCTGSGACSEPPSGGTWCSVADPRWARDVQALAVGAAMQRAWWPTQALLRPWRRAGARARTGPRRRAELHAPAGIELEPWLARQAWLLREPGIGAPGPRTDAAADRAGH